MDAMQLYLSGADDDELDMLGLDGDDDEFMGAVRRTMARRATPRRSLRRALVAKPAGTAPTQGLGMYYLGFPVATFTPAGALAVTVQANTQKPFKPMKFVSNRADTGAPGGLLSITQALIGTENVLLSAQGLPQAAFEPATTLGQQNIAWPEAKPGITCAIQYTDSAAPAAMTQIDVGSTIAGPTAI